MIQEKKYLGGPQGSGNFDDAFFAVGPNSWINMDNCRSLTTDAGETGTIESIGSTILLNNPYLPEGINIRIGSPIYYELNRIIIFNWNSNGDHAIFCYDLFAETFYKVVLNSQASGGLNFDINSLIHSARIVNGCAYWTDNLNEPRRIDIDAGIKLNHPSFDTTKLPYTSPLSQAVIAWIRRQPGLPPLQTKVN